MNLPAAILLPGLFALWFLLSGHDTGLLLALGALSCVSVLVLYYRVRQGDGQSGGQYHILRDPLGFIGYSVWLVGEIVRSALAVLVAVITRDRLAPEFFTVDTGELNEMGRVIYANSITLTPGTVSARIEHNTIHVHGLLRGAREALTDGEMLRRVASIKGATGGPR